MFESESEWSPTLEIEIDTEAQRARHYEDARSIGCSRSIWSQVLGVVDLCETMGNCGPCALIAKLPEITVLIPAQHHEYAFFRFQASLRNCAADRQVRGGAKIARQSRRPARKIDDRLLWLAD